MIAQVEVDGVMWIVGRIGRGHPYGSTTIDYPATATFLSGTEPDIGHEFTIPNPFEGDRGIAPEIPFTVDSHRPVTSVGDGEMVDAVEVTAVPFFITE